MEQYRGSTRASEEKIKQWEQRSVDTGMERSEDSSILGIIEALKHRDRQFHDGVGDGALYPMPMSLSPMVRDEHDSVREEEDQQQQQEDEDDDDYDDDLAGLSLSFASEETREFYRQLRRPTENKLDESERVDDLAPKHIEVVADNTTVHVGKEDEMGGKEDGEMPLSHDASRWTDASSLHPRMDGSMLKELPIDRPKDLSTSKGVSMVAGSLLDISASVSETLLSRNSTQETVPADESTLYECLNKDGLLEQAKISSSTACSDRLYALEDDSVTSLYPLVNDREEKTDGYIDQQRSTQERTEFESSKELMGVSLSEGEVSEKMSVVNASKVDDTMILRAEKRGEIVGSGSNAHSDDPDAEDSVLVDDSDAGEDTAAEDEDEDEDHDAEEVTEYASDFEDDLDTGFPPTPSSIFSPTLSPEPPLQRDDMMEISQNKSLDGLGTGLRLDQSLEETEKKIQQKHTKEVERNNDEGNEDDMHGSSMAILASDFTHSHTHDQCDGSPTMADTTLPVVTDTSTYVADPDTSIEGAVPEASMTQSDVIRDTKTATIEADYDGDTSTVAVDNGDGDGVSMTHISEAAEQAVDSSSVGGSHSLPPILSCASGAISTEASLLSHPVAAVTITAVPVTGPATDSTTTTTTANTTNTALPTMLPTEVLTSPSLQPSTLGLISVTPETLRTMVESEVARLLAPRLAEIEQQQQQHQQQQQQRQQQQPQQPQIIASPPQDDQRHSSSVPPPDLMSTLPASTTTAIALSPITTNVIHSGAEKEEKVNQVQISSENPVTVINASLPSSSSSSSRVQLLSDVITRALASVRSQRQSTSSITPYPSSHLPLNHTADGSNNHIRTTHETFPNDGLGVTPGEGPTQYLGRRRQFVDAETERVSRIMLGKMDKYRLSSNSLPNSMIVKPEE